VKALRQLHARRHREETARFLIDGVRLVEAALRAGAPIDQLLVAAGPDNPRLDALLAAARDRGIPLVPVAPHVLAAVSGVETPQGVVAVVRRRAADLDPLLGRPDLLVLIVDRVQDPGNLGTMIRTADAAGATAVLLLPGTVDALNPKAVRATMGSLFDLPVLDVEGDRLRAALREHGIRLLAADADAPVDFREADYHRPLAIAVGNEGEGLAGEWRAAAEAAVRIPLYGGAESLNVAVAAALLLYAAAPPVYTDADRRRLRQH
jgi:TrmH family RNA methyltransferase